MNPVDTVTVYNFRVFDDGELSPPVASFKAPRDVIRTQFRGELLEGTGEEVEPSALDAEGRYRRIATGWGELAD